MTREKKSGGDAPFHPQNELDQQTGAIWAQQPGVTKREWYAGLAMLGLITHYGEFNSDHDLAKAAFGVADAMIKKGEGQ